MQRKYGAAARATSPRTRRKLKEAELAYATSSPTHNDPLSPSKLRLQRIPQPFKVASQLRTKPWNT